MGNVIHVYKSSYLYKILVLPVLLLSMGKQCALIWLKMVVLKVEIDGGYASSLFKNYAMVIHCPLILITFHLKRSNGFVFAVLYWYMITQLVVCKCSYFYCKILILVFGQ
jgi:hypothetical protein